MTADEVVAQKRRKAETVILQATAESRATAQVGETLMIYSDTRYSMDPHLVTVTKVGRKWLTVQRDVSRRDSQQYAIDDGRLNHDFTQGERAYGRTDWDMKLLVGEAIEMLTKAGLKFDYQRRWSDAEKVALADWVGKNIL
jgi:hypothetical protein